MATGNATIALFAVALAGIGLLTTVGVIVSMDSFGPVTDNAQGIAEMSGDVEGDAAQALTTLDAIGNTTKTITKGIAIATAVLAATALFGAFRTSVESALTGKAAGTFSLDVAKPNVLVGVIIGASIVFLFASLLIMAVGRAAQRVVLEVRNQFRNHPGIMTYEEKPDYSRVVDIVTKDSLRELVTPGLLAVLAPIAVGFALGYQPLGSYLAGAIAVGVLWPSSWPTPAAPGTTPRNWSRTATTAARAPRRTPPPSSATPWATRSRTPPTCPQADRGITAIPGGAEVTRTGFDRPRPICLSACPRPQCPNSRWMSWPACMSSGEYVGVDAR